MQSKTGKVALALRKYWKAGYLAGVGWGGEEDY